MAEEVDQIPWATETKAIRHGAIESGCDRVEVHAGGKGEPWINYFIDSKCSIESYMTRNDVLTEQIQESFEAYPGGSWADWIRDWVIGKTEPTELPPRRPGARGWSLEPTAPRQWEIGEPRSDNTYGDGCHMMTAPSSPSSV